MIRTISVRSFVSLLSLPLLAMVVLLSSDGRASAWGWPLFGENAPPGSVPYPYHPSYWGYNLDGIGTGYYGGANYNQYYSQGRSAFPRGYGLANFPDSVTGPGLPPDYRGPQGLAARFSRDTTVMKPEPSPIMQGGKVAHILVEVPADAEVWIEGQKTQQAGTNREFISPALERNMVYEYRIRARWTEQGQQVEQTQRLSVQAGERPRVSFPTGDKKEIVGVPAPFPLAGK
jgi:uncharacterized protein (TIGR03000 family)